MTDCPDDDRLVDLVGGLLSAEDERAVDAHLDGCDRCRATLALFAASDARAARRRDGDGDGDRDGDGDGDRDGDRDGDGDGDRDGDGDGDGDRDGDRDGDGDGDRDGDGDGDTARPATARGLPERYLLLDLLGAGAMSVVYAAYDRALDRKVAIKLLRDDGAAEPGRTDRLRREAQTMARLAHPNVLPVFDVGAAGDRVYLTAELVVGDTLAGWLATKARGWREVVAVLVQAGRGLAAAHAAGIVHRDVKPSNVLVGDDGRVRVADFGLASATTPIAPTGDHGASTATALGSTPGDESTSLATGLASSLDERARRRSAIGAAGTGLVGTPAYMAPEQLDGAIRGDPTTDQYGFCVTLFEALTGARPYQGDTVGALRAAMDGPVPRLPAAIPATSERRLRRVLVRGLAPSPAARYPGLAALVDDLEATLHGRRWRGPALAATALVTAGLVFALTRGGAPPACPSTDELAGVWDAGARAALVTGFTASGHPDGATLARRAVVALDAYAAGWSAMRLDACRATHVRHTQSPAALDARVRCLDDRRGELSALVTALRAPDRPLVARSLEAVSRLAPVAGCGDVARLLAPVAPPADLPTRAAVDAARARLATATGLATAGRYREAMPEVTAVVEAARTTGYRPLVADALYRRGQLEGALGRNQDAATTLEQAVAEAAAAHDDALLARVWLALAEIVGHRLARPDEGLALARAAEAATVRADGDELARADVHQVRALLRRDRAQYREARTELEAALALRAHAPADDPRLAQATHDLAEVDRLEGHLDEAQVGHERALAARVAVLGPGHPLVAVSHLNLGHVFYARGDVARAREHYRAGLAIDEQALPPGHVELGNALVSLGAVELADDDAAAVATFERAGAIYRAALGEVHPLVAMVENNLGEAARRRGELATARLHLERALAIRRAGGDDARGVAVVLSNLGDILRLTGDRAGARARYQESLDGFVAILGPDGPMVAYPLVGRAQLELDEDPAAAVATLERARAIRAASPADPYERAEVGDLLARALWRARPGARARARELAAAAIVDYRASGGEAEARALERWLRDPAAPDAARPRG